MFYTYFATRCCKFGEPPETFFSLISVYTCIFGKAMLSSWTCLRYIQVRLQIKPTHKPVGKHRGRVNASKCLLVPFAQHIAFQPSPRVIKHASIKQGKPLPFLPLRTLDAKINNTGPRSESVLLLPECLRNFVVAVRGLRE